MRTSLIIAIFCCIGCSKSAERIQEEQKKSPPILITQVEGVKLYRVYDRDGGRTVYFTVPVGDTSWTIPGTDDTPEQHHNVPAGRK